MSASTDLDFIASAVRRRESQDVTPWPIAVSWAIYTAIGFTLADWYPARCWIWFFGAGLLNGFFSLWVGRRFAARSGVVDVEGKRRVALHWSAVWAACIAVIAIANTSRFKMDPNLISQFIVLSIGIIYFLAGVHFDRRYMPISFVLMLGAVVSGILPHWGWTITGFAAGVGLVLLAFVPRTPVKLPGAEEAK